jgi:hypothetical protein
VKTLLPANTSLTINGVATKQPAIDAQLQAWITVFQAVEPAENAYKGAVAARVAITAAAKAYVKALKAVIKSYFGAQNPQLASFGITSDKAASTSPQTKLVAAAKRKQTRTLHGTMGKKQKAAITVVGNPAVLVPSAGENSIGAPPVNIGALGPSSTASLNAGSTASSTAGSTPSTTPAAPTAPAPAGSGSGNGTSGSNTPAAS